jgi:hypothetical protein
MARGNRRYDRPHFELARVHTAASQRTIVITRRAQAEGLAVLPPGIIELGAEIREIVVSLVIDEFEFSERRTRVVKGVRIESRVDVYRIDFEGRDLWMKIKLEQDASGDFVVVISLHGWDPSRPT